MQCAACLEVYTDSLDTCPHCQEPDATPPAVHGDRSPRGPRAGRGDASAMMTDNPNVTTQTTQAPNNSTLIEFPGVNRNRPAWRKELSERFREIQQRRAREAELEAEAESRRPAPAREPAEVFDAAPAASPSEATKQLGLVPAPDEPEPNPIVVAALRRLERARQQSSAHAPAARAGSARAAAAVARAVEEQAETDDEPLPAPAHKKRAAQPEAQATVPAAEKSAAVEQPRASGFVVVPPKTAEKPAPAASAPAQVEAPARPAEPPGTAPAQKATAAASATKTETQATPAADAAAQEAAAKPRHVAGVIDDHWLERHGVEILPKVAAAEVTYDDRAPRSRRLAAALVDLLAVAFLCAPCAAVIELTIGDWAEPRVLASMGGIVAVMLFLYQTCSVALASRTFGMKLFRLHAVDAGTARVPTTWQCARRALVYMLSLATFGLGILYSLFDAEGRTAHDLLSGTVVVKE